MKNIIMSLILLLVIVTLGVASYTFLNRYESHDMNPSIIKKDTELAFNYNTSNISNENSMVVFTDFNCSYCKNYYNHAFQTIKKNYISNNKTNYRIVNVAILGEESQYAASAANATNAIYPKASKLVQSQLYNIQKNSKDNVTNRIDNILENSNIPNSKLKQIKIEYKNKKSKSWLKVQKDNDLFKKYHLEYVPTAYVNGRYIENPNDIESIKKNFN
ncbi:DsbA family protein [Staphylococcus equorum]|uniref:DsbA family protein n=1 Tax=Staphylococcus equorum TaxID=246432 RepID=UPI003EB8DEF3